jgi:anti-sigma factor RsiW
MNCRRIFELLPLYLCGDLGSQRAADFAAHLAACPECAQKVKREQYYDARLREIVLSDSPDAEPVSRRVHERIAVEPLALIPQRPSSRSARRFAAVAIGIAAAFVLVVLGYRGLLGPEVARVYAAAVLDHRLEVVDNQPRHWLTDPEQIAALAGQQGIRTSAILALAQQGYHLDRAKICVLGGQAFLHLVYSNGSQESSVYLRRQDVGELPDVARASANGKPFYTCAVDSGYVASFQKSHLAVMIISSESAAAAASFARVASSLL